MEELSIDETSRQVLGQHSIMFSEDQGPFQWITLLGVKLTTYDLLLLSLRISAAIRTQMAW